MSHQDEFHLLLLLAPLASAALIALFLRRQHTVASLVSVAAALLFAAGTFGLVFTAQRPVAVSWDWLQLGSFKLQLGVKFDDLAALMLTVVAIVGLCVHVFSLGYMKEDASKARYFGGLSIFMFSMLGIVLADNLFMMFVFWELVGFSSYVLINHFNTRAEAADAAKKAFIVNRVGDFGYLLGIIACYWTLGTVNLSEIATLTGQPGAVVATYIPLLLFCGAIGKSAQVPLHVWLPDAMEGPTPVSALIHAATMVAAGIYMVCRLEPLFVAAPEALNVVLWIGVVTAVYAAFCAITQRDIKKVLAYSTLSQLGYMVAAFGLGRLDVEHGGEAGAALTLVPVAAGLGAAMFHLTTHAFFKALLFLGSGSVIHGCHHEQDIFKMGGLAKKLPVTFATFTVGVAAIIGFPFLAGFFSKDAILYLAWENNKLAFVLLAFTAVLTSFYMVRLWKLTFLGTPRSDEAEHAHEGGFAMTGPLILLALLAVVGGYAGFYGLFNKAFAAVLAAVPHAHGEAHVIVLVTSIAVMLIGAGAAFVFYKPAPTDSLQQASPGLFALLASKLWIDEAYTYYVRKVQQRFALVLHYIDLILISGIFVRGSAAVAGLVGLGARALHVGSLHAYVYWFLLGTVVLWGFAAGWF